MLRFVIQIKGPPILSLGQTVRDEGWFRLSLHPSLTEPPKRGRELNRPIVIGLLFYPA